MSRPSSPHPYVAWFLDLWLLNQVGKLWSVEPPEWLMMILLAFWLAVFVGTVLYHFRWADRTRFLTFGEVVAGRTFVDGRKVWVSPYPCSRVPLYTLMAAMLLIEVSTGSPNEGDLVIRATGVAVAAVSMLFIGRGIAAALPGLWIARVVDYMQDRSVDEVMRPAPFSLVQLDLIVTGILCIAMAAGYTWVVLSRREPAGVR